MTPSELLQRLKAMLAGERSAILEAFRDGSLASDGSRSITPQEMGERQRDAENDLAATRKAGEILRKGGANAYQAARRALSAGLREWWDVRLSDDEGDATAESFAEFVRDELYPFCYSDLQEVQFTPAIKAQTLGEGVQAHRLEKLNRYETHLDRKFERTLAMLLKLKDLRGE